MQPRAVPCAHATPLTARTSSPSSATPARWTLDELNVEQCLVLLHNEDRTALEAVGKAQPRVQRFIEAIEPRMREGGRLVYLGAGTSGRLGVLDASECPPTYQTDPGLIVGLIAGATTPSNLQRVRGGQTRRRTRRTGSA